LVLIDLVDAVAEALDRPFADISVEMVFRSLYHAAGPYERGEAASVVAYLAAHAKSLSMIQKKRSTPGARQAMEPEDPASADEGWCST
jgi:hypothetical protein